MQPALLLLWHSHSDKNRFDLPEDPADNREETEDIRRGAHRVEGERRSVEREGDDPAWEWGGVIHFSRSRFKYTLKAAP